ncbi:protein NRT1/ PTR FAMILY 8.1 isoform X2 [Selaginella moellendorffii]|nr:protein NRT1/ PTR FAMILY 8.1 isoform X2 [Selaginella moellendorffii]|eukprot:XP_002962950.2 protein NRT1/ PTR FAMILY 8.1 isoform X2 [Selaginella moellendorffii]
MATDSAAIMETATRDDDLYTKDGTVDICGRRATRASTGLWKAAGFVLVNQALVSVTYYGIYNNLVRYLTNVLHQSNATAASNVNLWTGTSSITALIGGFISDSYLGRYWTTTLFLFVYLLGMILLTLSAALPSLKPPSCDTGVDCQPASPAQTGVFFFAVYLGALASGAYQPCNSSLGADQFDEENPDELPKMTAYFNWFYQSMTVGALLASTLVLYTQENVSWSFGFGICTIAMGLAVVVFLIGTPLYRNHGPGGNPLVRVFQVLVATVRKMGLKNPNDASLLYEVADDKPSIKGSRKIQHTTNLQFLDKAAIILPSDLEEVNPWRLCTVSQVEEVKCIIRMLPILLSSIVYSIVYSQMATLFLEQGGTMDTHLGRYKIPPGSLSVFENLSILVCTPTYEWFLVPLLRRFTKHPKGLTDLQRIGTGLVVIMLSMVVAALVEIRRLGVARDHGQLDSPAAVLPMSVFWLVPQYFLVGASEVFTFIGLIEFFYDQSPDGMRALGSSFQLTALACGNYSSSLVVTIVNGVTGRRGHTSWIADNLNRAHFDYFYWMLAVVTGIDLVFFMVCAYFYKYIKTVSFSNE